MDKDMQRLQEIEKELYELIPKSEQKTCILFKFGQDEFILDGGYQQLADFMKDSGFDRLRRIHKLDGDWYSWDIEKLGLNESYNADVKYSTSDAELAFDVRIENVDLHIARDAKRIEYLRKEYFRIKQGIQSKEESKKEGKKKSEKKVN